MLVGFERVRRSGQGRARYHSGPAVCTAVDTRDNEGRVEVPVPGTSRRRRNGRRPYMFYLRRVDQTRLVAYTTRILRPSEDRHVCSARATSRSARRDPRPQANLVDQQQFAATIAPDPVREAPFFCRLMRRIHAGERLHNLPACSGVNMVGPRADHCRSGDAAFVFAVSLSDVLRD